MVFRKCRPRRKCFEADRSHPIYFVVVWAKENVTLLGGWNKICKLFESTFPCKRFSNKTSFPILGPFGCVKECWIFIFLIKAAKVIMTLFFLFNVHRVKLSAPGFLHPDFSTRENKTPCINFLLKIHTYTSGLHRYCNCLSVPQITPLRLS